MNNSDKLFIQCKKNELINTLDSGMVKEAVQQYALVDGFILDVFRLFDKVEYKTFENYLNDQNKLKEQIKAEGTDKEAVDKKIVTLIEEYGKNARDMYEEIKKL